ncbi:DUF2953 domain-containing protein [Desulfuribacillus alkaliarsenatis]|uniref:DUF2953 domain-containing protein n=1 Tax=Desulfuribacillus alkaliarsenatis TaxID=766136 RepID=A0A1E5G5N5_9FIRM|nr:DUF2953 domain-containing protein [Desulfuribacillus alkaliarsenatis]OEF98497.1 hypothetical protein BHF68_02145 [Desulfuribacillus alkaliarsenatis]
MLPWYLILLIFLSFFVLLILITNTKVEILFQRHGDENDYLSIKLVLLRFITIKKEFPIIDIVKKDNKLRVRLKSKKLFSGEIKNNNLNLRLIRRLIRIICKLTRNLHHFLKQMRQLLNGFKIIKFQWTTHIGIDDAAVLGPTVGGMWALKGTLLQQVFYFFPLLSKPSINVTPEFQQNHMKTQLHCIFQFKVGYAMYVGIKFLNMYRKGVRHV